jgi:hypothetical protein
LPSKKKQTKNKVKHLLPNDRPNCEDGENSLEINQICPEDIMPGAKLETRARSFGQFKKHALFKARGQSPCFSYPGLARAFKSPGSADLFSFGGVSVGWPSDLLRYLAVYERAKMRPVYALIVALTDFLSLFCIKQML